MSTIASLLLFYGCAYLLLGYCGFWAARLLLPPVLRRSALLTAPLLGFGVLVITASLLNSTLLAMPQVTAVVLMGATALNGWAVARTGWPRRPSRWTPEAGVLLLGLGAYLMGSFPMVLAGSTAFVGQQWDLELYLPITEYLKRAAVGSLVIAPDNPLVAGMNTAPFRGGSGWGFSYFQAAVDGLLGWMSYQSLRPALQLWVALSVGAVYLFARYTLGTRPLVAVLAAGAWALNGLTFWVAASGLAGHAVSFATLPFALTLSIAALERPRTGIVLAAAVAVASMLLSYYTGALPLFGALLACMAVSVLLRRDGRLRHRVTAGAAGVAAVGALALVGHLRVWEVLPLYARDGFTAGWGSARYVPLAEVLGLVPDSIVAAQTRPAGLLGAAAVGVLDGLASVLTVVVIAACVVTPLRSPRGWRRERYLACCVVLVAAAVALRYVAEYPYGYFKLLSLGAFLFPIGLAQAAWALWRHRPQESRAAWHGRLGVWRSAVGVAAGALLLLWGMNLLLGMRFFLNDPWAVRPAIWELAALRQHLPAGSAVRVVGNGALSPQENAMLAYFLIDNPMVGAMRTAYGSLARQPGVPGPEYLVMPAAQDGARPPGAQAVLWANGLVTLYRMDTEITGAAPPADRASLNGG